MQKNISTKKANKQAFIQKKKKCSVSEW